MCGELEEQDEAAEFYNRYVAHAHSVLATLKPSAGKGQDVLHVHLDKLFKSLLFATLDEGKAPKDVSGYERLAMEPLVFARLAGFMAAHLPLSEDPLRRVIEAVMMGYSEGEIAVPMHDRDHGHSHGHTH